ncbi:hypothetical protein JCM3765_002341 [Sporobolomyces pararoseus]
MTRSNPVPLEASHSASSIPAVPEFSMPPSSGATPTPSSEQPSSSSTSRKKNSEKHSSGSNGGRFKIVFKGNTTEQENNPIAPPLPHPPSPSAPTSSNFSSTASPDPDSKPSNSSSLLPPSQLPTTLGSTQPSTAANEPQGSDSVVIGSNGKPKKEKVRGKGKGKKGKKGGKRKSKDTVLELPTGATVEGSESLPAPSTSETTGGGGAEVGSSVSASMVRSSSINRVCHHHRSLGKGEVRMTCTNNPDCRTVWCKNCVEKYYLDQTPTSSFVEGTTFLCPVCTDRCKCSNCRKRRKEKQKLNSSTSRAASTAGTEERSVTPSVSGVKTEDAEDQKPTISNSAAVDPFLLPSSTSSVSAPPTNSTPALQPILPATSSHQPQPIAPQPSTSTSALPTSVPLPSSGILKIKVKPPKRPRTERGTFVPHDSLSLEDEIVLAPPTASRRGRGGARRGAGRRGTHNTSSSASTARGYVQVPAPVDEGALGGAGGTSFFGRPPSLLARSNVGVAAGGGPRPKRTKKVSSHYDDFAVEGVPNFEEGGEEMGPRPTASAASTPLSAGGRETRSGVGRWGGYRRGAGGRRKTIDPFTEGHQSQPFSQATTPPLFPSASTFNNSPANMIGRDGRLRSRPRLSGLSSASSCSELSSTGGMDDEDDYEASYWAAKEALAERESDQRVRHWLLVPPTEPQPVLAGLERNLSEGKGEEVGFSPTGASELEAGPSKTKKEKVKWIEGPERRRRRAIALQKMKEEEDAKMKDLSQDVVKEDDQTQDESRKSLKRSLSWDASESAEKSKDLYSHCTPLKVLDNDTALPSASDSTTSSERKPFSLPIRPASAPILQSHEPVIPSEPQQEHSKSAYADQPPPYESHFPPSIHTPLPITASTQPPAIVVSPATTAPQSPLPFPISASNSSSSTPAQSPHSVLTARSTSLTSEADADLAARSADDKRLGLRLLDAIRTITGTKLAMEAMGIPPSALPTSSQPPATPSTPSASTSPINLPPSNLNTSPVKSESEDPFSLLISQEYAEYEALRREERHRLLSTALDPQKVFRAEAKGNDVSLLDRATDWGGGGMDVDSDESERKFRMREPSTGASMFDVDSFLVSGNGEGGGGDESSSGWHTSNSTSATASTSVTPTASGPDYDISADHPSHSIRVQIPETPSKLLSSSHHLTAPIPSFITTDSSHPWSSSVQLGGASTPTRGLVMQLDDFDFHGEIEWPSQ